MKKYLFLLLICVSFFSCKNEKSDYLLLKYNELQEPYYVNSNDEVIIPVGKYSYCFTDTFENMAIVYDTIRGFVGIDRSEKILFDIFIYDNGPDYVVEGLFRIVKNGLIGYANLDGEIVIEPKYKCAYPFENGKAEVSLDCQEDEMGEHTMWVGGTWITIDKEGKEVK